MRASIHANVTVSRSVEVGPARLGNLVEHADRLVGVIWALRGNTTDLRHAGFDEL